MRQQKIKPFFYPKKRRREKIMHGTKVIREKRKGKRKKRIMSH